MNELFGKKIRGLFPAISEFRKIEKVESGIIIPIKSAFGADIILSENQVNELDKLSDNNLKLMLLRINKNIAKSECLLTQNGNYLVYINYAISAYITPSFEICKTVLSEEYSWLLNSGAKEMLVEIPNSVLSKIYYNEYDFTSEEDEIEDYSYSKGGRAYELFPGGRVISQETWQHHSGYPGSPGTVHLNRPYYTREFDNLNEFDSFYNNTGRFDSEKGTKFNL